MWRSRHSCVLLPKRTSCHDLDVKTLLVTTTVFFMSLSAFATECPKNQPKTESALLELEHHWADALTHKDADAVACILADEFEDADVDGSVHTRAEALAKIPLRKPWTNRLSEMRAHVEGNSGFARGLNEILDADGKVVARVRFTDIFTYRDGRWQALAGHETLVGEAHR